jgi:hypothetical protein
VEALREMSDFCHTHGFYDCPVCRGEEIVWEIPVYVNGVQTGTLEIPEQGEPDVVGLLGWMRGEPGPAQTEPAVLQRERFNRQQRDSDQAPTASPRWHDHVSILANPWLHARVKQILDG